MMLLICFFLISFIQSIITDQILKFTIEEKLSRNTFIADLSIEYPLASYSLYQFLPINKNLFSINNQTGHLTTTSEILDRDQMCLKQQCSCNSCEIFFQLNIQLKQTIISKIIIIKIKDINDHSPVFDNQSILHTIYINENVPLGYRIVLPIAYDPDEGLNSIQSYSLDGINSDDFDIDYSFIDIPYLIVRSSLDRQRISSYSLTLIASDNNQPSKSRSGSIQLDIHIINDSIPIFPQSIYRIDVKEDTTIGTSLLKIEAINDNNNNNHQIFYELLTESPFIIDRLTGNVQLKTFLDYEKQKSYRLTIKAYENSIPSYAIIFIQIIDINDNPVLIHIKVQGNTTLKQTRNDKNILFIPEDISMGTTLGHVILNDLDSFANGNPYLQLTTIEPPLPLTYRLIYENNFENTKIYSLILHAKVDREIKSIYNNIQLIGHDSGTPTLHTRLFLSLNITDINDCIPQIITNSTIYNINENNPVGLIIDTLKGYDCDIGLNRKFQYLLLNQTDLLVINSQTGQLILNQSIDFDKLNHSKYLSTVDLEFLVQIHDYGQPSLSSQTKIILRIHDLNDNSPEFDQNQSYNWTFSQSIFQTGSILGRIIAYDNDSGLQGIVHYSINSFDSCFILGITPLGYIYLQSQSSCSSISYTFEITASDYGTPNPRLTKQLLILNIISNEIEINSLPKLVPLSIERTIVDINSIGNISFILDITTNQSIAPKISLNNTDLLTCWNISSRGEVRLIDKPYALSYILLLNIIDQFSIRNSCEQLKLNDEKKENDLLLFWAICLALIITCICVFIFSIITCLCCRKKQGKEKKLPTNQQQFLQCNQDMLSDKTFKTSSGSTIRDDDHDSACIINTNSSTLSSGIIPIRKNSWDQSSNNQNYQSSTYIYDIKLAELIRNNQHPPCVYLNSQSLSDDYGFASSEISPTSSSYSSIRVDQSPPRQINKHSFVSNHECVV